MVWLNDELHASNGRTSRSTSSASIIFHDPELPPGFARITHLKEETEAIKSCKILDRICIDSDSTHVQFMTVRRPYVISPN
jgi:hypothetical protein